MVPLCILVPRRVLLTTGAEGPLRIDGHFVSPGCSRLLPYVGGPDEEVDQCGGGCVAGPFRLIIHTQRGEICPQIEIKQV